MEIELREALRRINDKLDGLLPLSGIVARHESALYGNGHDGLVITTEKLQTYNRFYNKLFSGIGAVLTFLGGNLIWKAFTEKR
jgi:hypothetical protein